MSQFARIDVKHCRVSLISQNFLLNFKKSKSSCSIHFHEISKFPLSVESQYSIPRNFPSNKRQILSYNKYFHEFFPSNKMQIKLYNSIPRDFPSNQRQIKLQ